MIEEELTGEARGEFTELRILYNGEFVNILSLLASGASGVNDIVGGGGLAVSISNGVATITNTAQGQIGPPGGTGPRGPAGPQGERGPEGKGGNDGSSIQGPASPQGPEGPRGPDGAAWCGVHRGGPPWATRPVNHWAAGPPW